jgi:excisionase family DNA binding protein
MAIESLTYCELAARLNVSREAVRALVRRYRLPRAMGNGRTVRVQVDLTEIAYAPAVPKARPDGDLPNVTNVTTLRERVTALQAELAAAHARDEASSAQLLAARADYERLATTHDHLVASHGQLIETHAALGREVAALREMVTIRARLPEPPEAGQLKLIAQDSVKRRPWWSLWRRAS